MKPRHTHRHSNYCSVISQPSPSAVNCDDDVASIRLWMNRHTDFYFYHVVVNTTTMGCFFKPHLQPTTHHTKPPGIGTEEEKAATEARVTTNLVYKAWQGVVEKSCICVLKAEEINFYSSSISM